jgi:peptidoglycan glycosyltransferase
MEWWRVNRPIRRVGLGLVVLMLALVAQLSYVQLARSASLNADPANFRVSRHDFVHNRGQILTSDGDVMAESLRVPDELKYLRVYPKPGLYSQITGFVSLLYGSTGVERTYGSALLGHELPAVQSLFNGDSTENVRLTINSKAQQAAADGLANRRGSVVVLDTQTGGIVALFSNPNYDPNMLATHNTTVARNYFEAANKNPTNPMLARAYRELYPPGSTFKIVTATTALERAIVTLTQPIFPSVRQIPLPQTNGRSLSNFGHESCGGNLVDSFRHSCNTSFGLLAQQLGDALTSGAQQFGFGIAPPPLDIAPGMVGSRGVNTARGDYAHNQPAFMLDAIGQNDIEATPLQMALTAEAVANGGRILVPHVLQDVEASSSRTVTRRAPTQVWRTVMSGTTAAALNNMMQKVVESGTGTPAQIPGIKVAGKTGTAETGVPGEQPHAWFVGFAPAEHPRYVVAVLVEHGGNPNSEVTGGTIAAPIARDVLEKLLIP